MKDLKKQVLRIIDAEKGNPGSQETLNPDIVFTPDEVDFTIDLNDVLDLEKFAKGLERNNDMDFEKTKLNPETQQPLGPDDALKNTKNNFGQHPF